MGSSSIAQGGQLGALHDLEGWDREDGREAQEGGDMGTYDSLWCTTETNTVL